MRPHGLVACQAPLSMGFSRQECWSGLLFPSPGDLPNTGIKPMSPALDPDSYTLDHPCSLLSLGILREFTMQRHCFFVPLTSDYITSWKAFLIKTTADPGEQSASPRVRSGFPGGSVVKESTCQCSSCGRCRFHPWVRKILPERK